MVPIYTAAMTPTARPRALRPSRWAWAYALCLALALRALVPGGYMPDPAASAQNIIALTICTAHDYVSIDVAPIIPSRGHPAKVSNHDCPLCLLAHHATGSPLVRLAFLPVPLGSTSLILPATGSPAIRIFRELGSPLGPRAPPRINTLV